MSDSEMMRDSELLARAVRGELGHEDSQLLELFERRPEWREVLDELADSGEEGAPAELRSLARTRTTEADRERMGALVAHVATAAPKGARGRPRWRFPLLLAAAVAAVLGVLWWGQPPPAETPRGPFLGGGQVSWVSPTDTVPAWETFTWEAELPRGGRYALTVRADVEAGTLLAREEDLREPRWSPDPANSEGWPDAIVVSVEVLEASGILRASLDVSLRRSRP